MPGLYISYNPTASPPPPTTMTSSVTIAPPSVAVKGGAINTPTTLNTAVQMIDAVYAGGQPIGSMVAGRVQENIPTFIYYDGTQGGTGGTWYPDVPSAQFNFTQGKIYDQFAYGYSSQQAWNALPNGGTICNWTQQLHYQWTMTTAAMTNITFTVNLNTLTWTWVKVSATQWMAQ